MSCIALYNDILDGTVDINDLSTQQLTNLWGCLGNNEKGLLGFYISTLIMEGVGGGEGAAVFGSGTGNAIPAGAKTVIITKTNASDSLLVEGQTLAEQWMSVTFEAPAGRTLPAITIVPTGASTHAWTTIT